MKEIKPSELVIDKLEETKPVAMVTIPVEEYVHLKDIQTRFEILKNEMIHSSYCPIHHQIILGIENEYSKKEKELNAELFAAATKKK